MAEERVQRRLAAILIADVVGYSRLMESDEEGTRARLRSLHETIIDHNVAEDGGRIVKTSGDGTLVEFPSAVDAVRNAVRTQAAIRKYNHDTPEERRIVYRVGINVGDIIVEGDDIFGDGVNVASRLEGLCAPGEIYISGNVYDHVKDKLPVAFEDLGTQTVKNISNPVRMYRVFDAGKITKITVPTDPASTAPPPPRDKPSIAVLPFDNLSGDPEQEYFSDGITEDIIAALSRIRQFFVIARNTTFTYKDQAVDVPTVARDLGVRYVLEGSVRKAGNRIRLTAQLIDGDTGNHIWAEKYDRELEDIFEVQDEITQTVVGAIEPEMDRAERARAKLKNPESLDTWDCFHRGMSEYFDPDKFEKKEHVLQALSFFEKAIESDRAFAPAYAGMSLALSKIAHLGHSASKTEDTDKGIAAGRRAIEIDDDASLPRFALGTAYMMAGRHEEAISQFRHGIDINPSSALNYGNLAISLSWSGRAEDAIPHFETALRLSPRDPLVRPWMDLLAQAHLHIGQYDEALAWRNRAASQPGDGSFWGYGHMVCILGHLGRIDDAKKAIAELLHRKPDFTCKYYRENYPVTDSGYMELYLEGLRKAGIPEG